MGAVLPKVTAPPAGGGPAPGAPEARGSDRVGSRPSRIPAPHERSKRPPGTCGEHERGRPYRRTDRDHLRKMPTSRPRAPWCAASSTSTGLPTVDAWPRPMRGFATMHVRLYALAMCTVNDESPREAAGVQGAGHVLRRRRTQARPPAWAAASRSSPASARPTEKDSIGVVPRCASATLVQRSGEQQVPTVDVDLSDHVRHGALAPVSRRLPCSGTWEELPRSPCCSPSRDRSRT